MANNKEAWAKVWQFLKPLITLGLSLIIDAINKQKAAAKAAKEANNES